MIRFKFFQLKLNFEIIHIKQTKTHIIMIRRPITLLTQITATRAPTLTQYV